VLVGLTGGDGVEVYDVSGKEARLVKTSARPARARTPFAPLATAPCVVSNRVANTISKIDTRPWKWSTSFPARAGRTAWTSGRRQD
jgi:hypothetical protein